MGRLRILPRRRRDRRALLLLLGLIAAAGLLVWKGSRRTSGVEAIVRRWARSHGLDEALVRAVIEAESGFRAGARSSKGALGLMQVMPETGREVAARLGIPGFRPEDLLDPETNVRIGTWYLAEMLRRFPDERLALAAYNAGPGRVQAWMRERPGADPDTLLRTVAYRETREYVGRVLRGAR